MAFNRPIDEALAKHIREFRSPTDGETRMFYEIVIAPGFTPEVCNFGHPHNNGICFIHTDPELT